MQYRILRPGSVKQLLGALLICLGLGAAAPPAPPEMSLEAYVAQISATVQDQASFRALAGPTVFDDMQPAWRRFFGQPRIVSRDRDGRGATLLLSATAEHPNSGDQTLFSSWWSGLYRVTHGDTGWRLGERIPFTANRLLRHQINMNIDPGVGLQARDEIDVEVGSSNGLPLFLNRGARITSLRVGRAAGRFDFQNGLLWIDVPRGRHRVTVDYNIQVDKAQESGNSGTFGPDNGYLRTQYFWHPSLGFGEDAGLAAFTVRASIPQEYQLALDIPQTERIVDGKRVVEAASVTPAEWLSVAYDKDWQTTEIQAGDITLTLFATRDFTPSAAAITRTFSRAVRVLGTRFGQPSIKQIKIIQLRRRADDRGWPFTSNQAIFGNPAGGPAARLSYPVRVFLGHEISHLWTRPTGWARHFLGEGWAMYVESLILRDQFDLETARQFWRDQARQLMDSDANMSARIRDDRANSGVSYYKGSWVLKMLEKVVGEDAFSRAMTHFVAQPRDRTSYEDFLAGFGAQRATAERFLTPWVSEPGLPVLAVTRSGEQLILSQTSPLYWLPNVTVRLVHPDGSSTLRVVDVQSERTAIDLPPKAVNRVELDPFEDYLLKQRFFDIPGRAA